MCLRMPPTVQTNNMELPFSKNRIDLQEEPFRIFFPLAVFCGIAGVAVWPLHFTGWLPHYPGPGHTRLMVLGFFGGFILGFLGTALPRMLSTPPFHKILLRFGLGLYLAIALLNFIGINQVSDMLSWILLTGLVCSIAFKFKYRHINKCLTIKSKEKVFRYFLEPGKVKYRNTFPLLLKVSR